MKGVVLAGGTGSRLNPLTKVTNKHLLPVYDKPMVYYPIQTLVNAGVEEILLVTGGKNAGDFLRLLGNGRDFGLKHLNYTYQEGEGGIADALAFSRNPATMVEHVRARLARQICAQNTTGNGYLPLVALSAKWEQAFAESLVGTGEERSLAMQPSKLSEFMTVVRERFEQAAREGEAPVLVTSAAIRPFVRSLVERFRSQTTVLSQAEIHPRARLKTVGSV